MRFKGALVDWKDDRGFGFIEPAEGSAHLLSREGIRSACASPDIRR